MTFKHRLEGSERVSQADIWRKNVPNKGNSQDCVWPASGTSWKPLEAKCVREGGVVEDEVGEEERGPDHGRL